MRITLFFILTFISITQCYSQTAEEYYANALSKYNLKDYKGALSDYSKAIEINPNIKDIYKNRGLAEIRQLDYQGAIADFSKHLEYNPNDADAYYNRGLSKVLIKQKEDGCKDLAKADKLGHEKAAVTIQRNCN